MAWSFKAERMLPIFEALSFPAPQAGEKVIFFGVRSSVPLDDTDRREVARLDGSRSFDHENFRCTLGQWWPGSGEIAIYPASTVPSKRYVRKTVAGGMRTNMLAPGLWKYKRGIHKANTPSAHDAFREASSRLVLRTTSDTLFDWKADQTEVGSPYDNIHAAFGTDSFSSAGCQVVKGKPGSGLWTIFKNRGYAAEGQVNYRYLLLPAETWKLLQAEPVPMVLVGSKGERATAVQEKLIELGLLDGPADGDFGPRSALALLKFQRRSTNHLAATTLCGADTARALGITDW
jgi:hypothetical protein